MAKRGWACGCGATGRRTICAIEKIPDTVGQFDDLLEQAVRRVEGRVHIPQRTVPPNFENGKVPEENRLETLPALSTRQQEERHAARVRPLQCGQAMTDLLEAGIETLRQHMDIVAERFRRGMEGLIGHHHGGGEIVRQRNPVEPARGIVERACAIDDGLETAAAFGQPDLKGELERAAGSVDQLRNQKLSAMPVEPPQRLAHDVDRHDAGDD